MGGVVHRLDTVLMAEYRFTLPYPPSANRYWRQTSRGVYVSIEAKAYKSEAGWIALSSGCSEPLVGEVALSLDVYRPRRSGDLSNRIKVLEDSLNGIAYEDDEQVAEIHARRFYDKLNPRVEVIIRTLE